MRDVFVLGAGFSKAIHSGMPTLSDLTREVIQRLEEKQRSYLQFLVGLEDNIELWITYLSQRQPWLSEYENDYNKSLAGRIRHQIGAVIEEHTARASQSEPPPWLKDLIRSWHHEQATIITLNYDTLVERACKQVQTSKNGSKILAQHIYPPYFSNVQARSGVGVLGEGSLKTFSFLKLHGSINWYYSGRDDFFGETILFSEDFPFGHEVWSDVRFRRPQSQDKELLIIPPVTEKHTYFNNETVKRLWREAGRALSEAERVFIIGYSLPLSDLGMKFFLTKHRPSVKTPIFLVNTDRGVVSSYRSTLAWDVRDDFVNNREPVTSFVRAYPNIERNNRS